MFRMAGSKQRATIQGNTVVAEAEIIQQLRRMPSEIIRPIFSQAKDHGSSPVMINNVEYIMHRQSDHTFLCQPGTTHRISL